MVTHTFETPSGISITREHHSRLSAGEIDDLIDTLDRRRGIFLTSTYEFPGRYSKWCVGFVDPPIVFSAKNRTFEIIALNARGLVLLPAFEKILSGIAAIERFATSPDRIKGDIRPPSEYFPEEQRSRQPSFFSVLRGLIEGLACEDHYFGFYGAFGYDLVFQFEDITRRLSRSADQRDLVLYLPDQVVVEDGNSGLIDLYSYEFATPEASTVGLPRAGEEDSYRADGSPKVFERHAADGSYEASVEIARDAFKRGDLFEVVLSQTFAETCSRPPSAVFRDLRRANPAPYGALINLGDGEFLVAASPEMFVRVKGRRIETCPISGTIARGTDALEDAERARTLINSEKDEAELTMCTDVDRNDKFRICEPSSVRILGRRQLEMYSRVIHTVDHVEGALRPDYDALDGFLSHAWAVTVTGAPKRWAIQFIEDNESSARRWYGGAFGRLSVDGSVDTGLTLRTIRMRSGVGEVRAGATLLYDSDPAAENAECALKASALLAQLGGSRPPAIHAAANGVHKGIQILMVDHEDSFVHTLSGYFRKAGAVIETLRSGFAREKLKDGWLPDLLVLSPGPGAPSDFAMSSTLELAIRRGIPVFGVCLGLQGVVEHFGGSLYQLERPVHGRRCAVRTFGGRLFSGLPDVVEVGRYHSLCADRTTLPGVLTVTAETDDGVAMAIEHRDLPIAAVQFHPESLMTSSERVGMPLIENVLAQLDVRPRLNSNAL
ncbi:MAG: anthranilate synthase component I [Pseudomonadota bacterium]